MAKPILKQSTLEQARSAEALKILARILARDAARTWLAAQTVNRAVEE